MAITTRKSAYLQGIVASLPFVFVVAPFAAMFGLIATEAGLSILETMAFSVVVVAGAAQLTALQLMQENAPTVVVLTSALAVNMRVAMYSASLTPYLGAAPLWQRALCAYLLVDQPYVVGIARYEAEPEMSVPARVAFFMGAVTPVIPLWYIFTYVGALLGAQIPDSWALDFAIPITFIAMIAPMFRTLAHVVAALVAVTVSLLAVPIPYSMGLIVAGMCGMVAGAQTELWLARKGIAA